MPKVSIILPTSRPGGMDVTFSGLQGQSFRDFELVWVDSIKRYRESHVIGKIANAGFAVTYVEPIDNPFPSCAFARCANTGIAHATGNILVFIQDFLWFPPDWLERHVQFHRTTRGAYSGAHTYMQWPKLKTLPVWHDHEYAKMDTIARSVIGHSYVEDLNKGLYDHAMWSCFEKEFVGDARVLAHHPEDRYADMKLMWTERQVMQPSLVHLKNESCAREIVLNMNGFDEDFNGAHGWQDTEFGERVAQIGSVQWHFDPTNPVYGVSPKYLFPRLRRIRPTYANRWLLDIKRARGYRDPVNDWNLREYGRQLAGGQ